MRSGTVEISPVSISKGIPIDKNILGDFSAPLDTATVSAGVILSKDGIVVPLKFSFLNEFKTFSATPLQLLAINQKYTLSIANSIKGKQAEKFAGVIVEFITTETEFKVLSLSLGGVSPPVSGRITNVPTSNLKIEINFSEAVDVSTITSQTVQIVGAQSPTLSFSFQDLNKKVVISVLQQLKGLSKYRLIVSNQIRGSAGETLAEYVKDFFSAVDPTPKFPVITDDQLLTLVQQQTFKYFYDFAHPASGMARERNASGDLVTSGGSGFGVATLIVGMERGFITRTQGIERLTKILNFLETCDRFHGAWPHWINGNTGKTIAFSANDNGADLVETAFMVQGLITMRQYLNSSLPAEQNLITRINMLTQAVEWDWFTRGSQNVLYWHWSSDKGWAMNMQINGYNEALIIYTLAAASPTHTISPAVYNNGWARNGAIRNNKLFYNIKLPVGYDFGGPLFFAHYSFLGLNPKNLSDQYANYWEQNVNHTLINRAYCVANPRNFVGYSSSNWGLTASDNQSGYSAHSPTNDLGVISPTAALSSMPYTPAESMDALKFFYYTMGDRLWGTYGFYDAFNVTEGWVANSYLAIDQGPIVIMIENHRTGLLWNLFMSAPEVQAGLTKLGFSY
ncbi:MAG: hypothetical protein HOP37_02500 [Cyclobacteriaceae bacterium]|nr:hypothetical protein [Cyclobacteriaceae bacterium]